MDTLYANGSNLIGTTIMNLIISCFFSTGYIGYFHRLWTEVFSGFDGSQKHRRWQRIQLVVLGCGVGLYLHLTTMFYFTGSIAMVFHDIALFLLIVPFMYKGGFNLLERCIQIAAFIYVWVAHHEGNMSEPHVIIALILTLVIIGLGQVYHDQVIYNWKFGMPFVFLLSFLFWKTLPHVSMNIVVTNTVAWEAIVIFVSMNITIMFFWLRNFRNDRQNKKMEQMADYDGLTGAKSFTYFQSESKKIFENAKRQRNDLALVELDIDRFKQINDFYGHSAGNQVLTEVTSTIKNVLERLGQNAQLYRTGGEEFTIIFPDQTIEQALPSLRECWSIIHKSDYFYKGEPIDVSVSMGGTSLHQSDQSFDDLYNRADEYLYMSKRNGRNQITIEGKVRFWENKRQKLLMLGAFFTQPVVDIESNQRKIQTELLFKAYDYCKSKWTVPNDIHVSIATQLRLINDLIDKKHLGYVGLTVSATSFLEQNTLNELKKYLEHNSEIIGLSIEITNFENIHDEAQMKKMSDLYHQNGIRIIISDVSDRKLDNQLQNMLSYVDGIRYAMQNIRVRETNEEVVKNIKAWSNIAKGCNLDFILDGIETSEDVEFARKQVNARYLQGYYFGIPDLPVLT